MALEVHTWEVNSNSGKPIIFLKEKGADFDFHYVDVLQFEQHQPEYLALNPEGTVPTVIHDGKVMTESTQALEYLDAVLPGPSFTPEDPLEAYRMRWWATHGASWAASLSVLGWHAFMGPMVRQMGDEKLEALLERIPNKQRRIAWATAAKSTFTEQQLQDARDGVAAGVQMMVRSDLASSGVAFTLDTESGFRDAVFITSSYGLGETVVQGAVNPDEFYLYKPALVSGHDPILRRNRGSKAIEMVFDEAGTGVITRDVEPERQQRFSLDDDEVQRLAR